MVIRGGHAISQGSIQKLSSKYHCLLLHPFKKSKITSVRKTTLSNTGKGTKIQVSLCRCFIVNVKILLTLTTMPPAGCGGVETPYSIYRWQKGDTVPSVDNLVILADIFDVAMDDIVVRIEL